MLDNTMLMEMLRRMMRIRYFEEAVITMVERGEIVGAAHSYIGEEAVAVGACMALRDDDWITGNHRSHGHPIAKGGNVRTAMAELLGKATGICKGKGGSMHLADFSIGILGESGILGSAIPTAVGAALGSKLQGNDRVSMPFFGDGASNEGAFHESINLAAVWNLPVIFLCENNLYGMGAHVSLLLAKHNEIYRLAEAYNIPSDRVDGMDVLAVQKATEIAVESIRSGHGPYFLEAATYRFRGHSMADPAEYRTRDEEHLWQQKDPIATYKKWLLEKGLATHEELELVTQAVETEIEEAIKFADESPLPPPEALFQNVYWESEK